VRVRVRSNETLVPRAAAVVAGSKAADHTIPYGEYTASR
jgi:hypothetical protein